ncbi:MAG: hypothetical protein R2715_08315 [Ilumatobacteraceae bacterium]
MAELETTQRSELVRLGADRHRDPAAVLDRTEVVLAHGAAPDLRALALWVRGLALHELSEHDAAVDSFRSAISISDSHGLTDVGARARAHLAVSLLQLGHSEAAHRALDEAGAAGSSEAAGLVDFVAALFAQRRGVATTPSCSSTAHRELIERDDHATIGLVHLNRSVSYAYADDLDRARDEADAAERLATEHGLTMLAAMAAHNLGFAKVDAAGWRTGCVGSR